MACGKAAWHYEIIYLTISKHFHQIWYATPKIKSDANNLSISVKTFLCCCRIESIPDNIAFMYYFGFYLEKQMKEWYLQASSLKKASDNSFAVLFAAVTLRYHVDMMATPLFYSLLLITRQSHTMN